MRTLWIALVVLATALAGCSDDTKAPVDPATECDGIYADDVCTPHVEPRITVSGLPPSIGAYSTVAFEWSIDNGTRGTASEPVHSMDSRILVSNEAGTVSNMTGPDEWGMELAREQHQNLPGSFEASLSWETMEMLYLRGYMLIEGENVWTDLGTINITAVEPTGKVAVVSIEGVPPGLDESTVGIVVGDAFMISNGQPTDYTAVFDCSNGVSVPELAVPASGDSDVVLFDAPTSCSYTLQPALLSGSSSPLDIDGTVNVNRP